MQSGADRRAMISIQQLPVAASDSQNRQVIEAVFDIGKTFAANLQLRPVLDRLIGCAIALADADAGSVMLVAPGGRELVVAAAIGPRAEIILGTRQPITASIAGQAIRQDEPLLIQGEARQGAFVSKYPRDVGNAFVIPLRVAGRLLGVLNLEWERARDN